MPLRRSLVLSAIVLATAMFAALWHVGTISSAPAPHAVGPPPPDLRADVVSFPSTSGSTISAWFLRGDAGRGAVLLLHGIRGSRLYLVDRARMLRKHGYSVLLIDMQAHGESPGRAITFGYLESRDVRAAVDFLRQKAPSERIGVLGTSLGGAAAILADPPLSIDALIAEQVFADIYTATANRVEMMVGRMGRPFTQLLTWQLKWRLGVDAAWLSPARAIAKLRAPLLLIAAEKDHHATMDETRLLWANATDPKDLWVLPDASHIDLLAHVPADYERRVADFLIKHLSR